MAHSVVLVVQDVDHPTTLQRPAWARRERLMPEDARGTSKFPAARPHMIDRAKSGCKDGRPGYLVRLTLRLLAQPGRPLEAHYLQEPERLV